MVELTDDSKLNKLLTDTLGAIKRKLAKVGVPKAGRISALTEVTHAVTLDFMTDYFQGMAQHNTFFLMNFAETEASQKRKALGQANKPIREIVFGFASPSHLQPQQVIAGFAVDEMNSAHVPQIDPLDIAPNPYDNVASVAEWFAAVKRAMEAAQANDQARAAGLALIGALEKLWAENPRSTLNAEGELIHLSLIRYHNERPFQIGFEMNLNKAVGYVHFEMDHYMKTGKLGEYSSSTDNLH